MVFLFKNRRCVTVIFSSFLRGAFASLLDCNLVLFLDHWHLWSWQEETEPEWTCLMSPGNGTVLYIRFSSHCYEDNNTSLLVGTLFPFKQGEYGASELILAADHYVSLVVWELIRSLVRCLMNYTPFQFWIPVLGLLCGVAISKKLYLIAPWLNTSAHLLSVHFSGWSNVLQHFHSGLKKKPDNWIARRKKQTRTLGSL